MLSLIVAMDQNRLIGNANQLPWQLSDDLKRFKAITMGKPIIMGRKTYESIGKPLPGRRNIVISRNSRYSAIGCEHTESLDSAISLSKNAEEAIVIGGAKIYQLALPQVERMYLTVIDYAFSGDAWFPEYDPAEWNQRSAESHSYISDNLSFSYQFITLEKYPIVLG